VVIFKILMPANTYFEVIIAAGWNIEEIISEYVGHAEPKVRDCDLAYIRAYPVSSLEGLFNHNHETARVPWRISQNSLRLAILSAAFLFLCFITWNSFSREWD
jgi:hypothetical protein